MTKCWFVVGVDRLVAVSINSELLKITHLRWGYVVLALGHT